MAATESDFTTPQETGATIAAQWPETVRALQALTALFLAKVTSGTEPADVLTGIMFGLDGQSTNHKDWRLRAASGGGFQLQENTGTDAAPSWQTRAEFSAGGGIDLNGGEMVLDADGDTSLTADTDDRIDIRLGGTDLFRLLTVASAINGLDFTASAASNAVKIEAVGGDAAISINLVPKGVGTVQVGGTDVLLDGEALANVVEDTTPQLGGDLDLNGNDLIDANGNEVLSHTATASAVNQLHAVNAITNEGPVLTAEGETNVPLRLKGKGTGKVLLGDGELAFPDADGSADQVIKTDGSGNLSFVDQGSSGGRTLLDSATASADASITLDITSGYDVYLLEMINVLPATDGAAPWWRFRTQGGSIRTGASDYNMGFFSFSSGGSTVGGGTAAQLAGRALVDNAATEGMNGRLYIYSPRASGVRTAVEGQVRYAASTDGTTSDTTAMGGAVIAASEDNDQIQFLFSSGNITSGELKLWGLKDS